MRIIIRSEDTCLRLPVPLCLASAAAALMPESLLEKLTAKMPPPYREVITKQLLQELIKECRPVFKQYKGLEIVHVEARDGAWVSIRL